MKTLAALLSIITCVSACSHKANTLPQEIQGTFAKAFNSDDVEKCIVLFANDAQVLPDRGTAIAGRDNIRQWLKDQMVPVVAFDMQTDLGLVRDDIAIEQGRYRVRDIRRGHDVEFGKYLYLWKQENGTWKIYRSRYDADQEPKTEVSRAPAR